MEWISSLLIAYSLYRPSSRIPPASSRSVDRLYHSISVRHGSQFHRAVRAARVEPVLVVDVKLRHPVAGVLEEAAAGVLGREGEERVPHGQAPYLPGGGGGMVRGYSCA